MIYVFEGGSIVYDESVLTEADKARAVAVEVLPEQEVIPGKIAVIKADKTTGRFESLARKTGSRCLRLSSGIIF